MVHIPLMFLIYCLYVGHTIREGLQVSLLGSPLGNTATRDACGKNINYKHSDSAHCVCFLLGVVSCCFFKSTACVYENPQHTSHNNDRCTECSAVGHLTERFYTNTGLINLPKIY